MTSSFLAPLPFSGRTAVVTGGGSGIGAAIATHLAMAGARIVVLGRSRIKLDAMVDGMRERGLSCSSHTLDVRDRTLVEETVTEIIRETGRIDHLVNCAAGNFRSTPEELSPNGWSAVVDIVLDGTWNMSQSIGRHMLAAGGGSILNIGTTMATHGSPTTVHSASAKAGVLAMTKSLASAWGPRGVRLNVLTPGITDGTAGLQALQGTEDARRDALETVPLRRFTTPDEVARVAGFLLGDEAAYITGAELVMDGGRSLGKY